MHTHKLTLTFTQERIHTLMHTLTHSLTDSLTHSLTHLYVVNTGAQAIAAGCAHSMVLKTDETVWVTGDNNFGQLGDGIMMDTGLQTFVKVSSGW